MEQLVENCSLWEGCTLEESDCLLWEGPYAGAGEEGEESSHEEKRVAETICDELTTAPIPHLPVPLGGRKVEKSGVKLRPGRREGWAEGVFKIYA